MIPNIRILWKLHLGQPNDVWTDVCYNMCIICNTRPFCSLFSLTSGSLVAVQQPLTQMTQSTSCLLLRWIILSSLCQTKRTEPWFRILRRPRHDVIDRTSVRPSICRSRYFAAWIRNECETCKHVRSSGSASHPQRVSVLTLSFHFCDATAFGVQLDHFLWILRLVSLRIARGNIFFPEDGVGLVPKRGCLLTLAYYAFPRWYEFGKRRWNDIDRGKPKNSEKNLSQSHFVHHKAHMDWPGRELGPPRWEAGY
jgi:hypothetical protein